MILKNQRDSPKRSIETSSCGLDLQRDGQALITQVDQEAARIETLNAAVAMLRNELSIYKLYR